MSLPAGSSLLDWAVSPAVGSQRSRLRQAREREQGCDPLGRASLAPVGILFS